jgi:hypothetical protein
VAEKKPSKTLTQAATRALGEFDQTTTAHDEFVTQYEKNRRSYQAVLEAGAEAAQWTHQLTPPYAEHIIETTIASMLDEQFRFRVTPKARLFQSPGDVERAAKGAKAFEILLTQQLQQDRFDEIQRPLVLQERLAGLSPVKVYWRATGKNRMRTKWSLDEKTQMPVWSREEEPETIRDGPCAEVVDVRDFFWDDQAPSIERCGLVAHRTWPTFEELQRLEKAGYYKNVDELPQTRDLSASLAEREKGGPDTKRGRIEVIEIWRRENGKIRVYTVGNRTVLLREVGNPFDHGEFPFVLFVGQSQPFRIPGRPQIEKLSALQEALWSVSNQRLDSLMFLNNAIMGLNEDLIDDIDAVEYYPGARISVHGDINAAMSMWTPNPTPAQVSIPAESMLKADLQNLAGGFPFTSTSEAQISGAAGTATEASLVASLAQRSIISAKRHLYDSYRRIGQMFVDLDQQFVREPVYALVVGADDTVEQQEIVPWVLDGDFIFDVEPMTESLMRQERRAEALSLFQAILPTAQVAALTGATLNTKKLYEHVLEAFDIQNTDAYFMPAGAAPPGGAPPPNAATPPNAAAPASNGGVTNPSLAAGPQAVSNGNSLAPASMMASMLGGAGDNRNA